MGSEANGNTPVTYACGSYITPPALRNKMDNLLDPDYKRFHLQEAFMATWGRMADPIFKG